MMTDIQTYSYYENASLLELQTTGVMQVGDIISHYVHIRNDHTLPKNLKVLIDARSTQLDLRVEDIALTNDAVKEALLNFDSLREAILVDKPYETAIATMFERFYSKIESYNFRVFSTENAARVWLMMNR